MIKNLTGFIIGDSSSNDTLVALQIKECDFALIVERDFNYSNLSCSIYSAGAAIGNNLGNLELQINATLYDLNVAGNSVDLIYAGNFSMDNDNDQNGCSDFTGFTNDTAIEVTSLTITNGDAANKVVGMCLEGVLPTTPTGSYVAQDAWIIGTLPV